MRYDDAIPEIGGKNLTQSRNSASAAAQLTNSYGRSMLPESLGIISKPTAKETTTAGSMSSIISDMPNSDAEKYLSENRKTIRNAAAAFYSPSASDISTFLSLRRPSGAPFTRCNAPASTSIVAAGFDSVG